MEYGFYLCRMIGTGVVDGGVRDPYRSKLDAYINPATEGYHSCTFNFKMLDLNTCWAESATHTAIRSDTDIVALSPLMPSMDDLKSWLSDPEGLSGTPSVKAALESLNINTGWISTGHINKDVLRYLRRATMLEQMCEGRWRDANTDGIKTLLLTGLDLKVNQIPPAIRTKVVAWMNGKGIDSSWISGTTTVREVVHSIVSQIQTPQGIKLIGIDL